MSMQTANRVCETCGCFRSEHPRGGRCKCKACDEFKFTQPAKAKRPFKTFTDEEVIQAREMLESGYTYAEVARVLGRTPATINQKFPGYGANAAGQAHGGSWKQSWAYTDRQYQARKQLYLAERKADGRVSFRGCAFEGGNVCDRTVYAQGLCNTHYLQYRRTGELHPIGQRKNSKDRRCVFEGCDRRHRAKGFCASHYAQLMRHGKAKPLRPRRPNEPDQPTETEE